jgi:C4-dicarboxylate-specific signal transduction histidine kinase
VANHFTAKDYYHTSRFSKVADVLVNSYSVGNVTDDRKFNVSARINHMTAPFNYVLVKMSIPTLNRLLMLKCS